MPYRSPLQSLARRYKTQQQGGPANDEDDGRPVLTDQPPPSLSRAGLPTRSSTTLRGDAPSQRDRRGDRANGMHGLSAAAKMFRGDPAAPGMFFDFSLNP